MCARWPSSLCWLLFWTFLAACSGTVSSNGKTKSGPAADGGQDAATDQDASESYSRDGGEVTDDSGAAQGDSGNTPKSELEDIEPAQCRPDPSDFTPCAGDIAGKWRMASICLDADVEDLRAELMCSELTQEVTFEYRMLVDFMSNGNYTAAVEAAAVQRVLMPPSCVPEEADGNCSAVIDDDTDDSDGRTVMVTKNGDGCAIEAREHRAISEAGTWKVSGNNLTMTNAIGPRTSEYCVRGSSLIVRSVNSATNEVSWGVFERL